MKLTKREAHFLHYDMWDYIVERLQELADKDETSRDAPDLMDLKSDYLEEIGNRRWLKASCYLCTVYDVYHGYKRMWCQGCPLKGDGQSCYFNGSLFKRVEDAIEDMYWEDAIPLAIQIRDCVKEGK